MRRGIEHNKRLKMKSKDFFRKLADKYFWGNILAMAIVVAALCFGVRYGLDVYTHHGESIPVPDVKGMAFGKAKTLFEANGLRVAVSDTGYNKRMPADCILLQNPRPGTDVKSGHIIYVTVNSPASPSVTLPDLVDNSSVREAEAKLMAMGFKLLEPRLITGEKEWVYGILAEGRHVSAGDRISIDVPLRLVIGNGTYDDSDMEIDYIDAEYNDSIGGVDEFEEVTGPPAEAEEPRGGTPYDEGTPAE